MKRLALCLAASVLLAGCSALPDKPSTPTLYDFGPPPAAGAVAPGPANARALVLEEVLAGGSFEGRGLMYRLAYSDPHRVQPYAYARWSAPAAQLLRQRIGHHLGRERPVLDPDAAIGLARAAPATRPPVLRLELEEFSQVFDGPGQSRGVLRLRASLLEPVAGGERLAGQRSFAVEQPAPTADAAGGVQALAAAADTAARQVADWLRGLP